jgi:hypothetical protein
MRDATFPQERLATSREKIRQSVLQSHNESDSTLGGLPVSALLALVQPVAQTHPIGLVVGAFLAGGALTYSRPLARAVSSALLAELLPRIAPTVAAKLLPLWAGLTSDQSR